MKEKRQKVKSGPFTFSHQRALSIGHILLQPVNTNLAQIVLPGFQLSFVVVPPCCGHKSLLFCSDPCSGLHVPSYEVFSIIAILSKTISFIILIIPFTAIHKLDDVGTWRGNRDCNKPEGSFITSLTKKTHWSTNIAKNFHSLKLCSLLSVQLNHFPSFSWSSQASFTAGLISSCSARQSSVKQWIFTTGHNKPETSRTSMITLSPHLICSPKGYFCSLNKL